MSQRARRLLVDGVLWLGAIALAAAGWWAWALWREM
jgi:hypothetical protein